MVTLLPGARRGRDGRYLAYCPAHEDEHPSLAVWVADDGWVCFKCRSQGCSRDDILSHLGLSLVDIGPERPSSNGHRPTRATDHEARRWRHGNFYHVRFEDDQGAKTRVPWANLDGTLCAKGKGPRTMTLPLYGVEHLADLEDGAVIYVAEGEPCADALRWAHISAVASVTGASALPCDESLRPLCRLSVRLWADADAAGRKHMEGMAARLIALGGRSVELVQWPQAGEKQDAVDMLRPFTEMGDRKAARAAVEALPREALRASEGAPAGAGERRILPPPSNPMATARELFAERRHHNGSLMLRHWRGAWMQWNRGVWAEVEDRTVRADAYRQAEHAVYVHDTKDGDEYRDWAPNRRKCADLLEAMAAVAHLSNGVHPPVWIDDASGPGQIVVCKNGLLDVASRELQQHDPRYFTQVSVPFEFDTHASRPSRWCSFLEQLWPDDPDAISTIQEFFGYVLSGRTDLDKILLLIGPTRAGKGVITRMMGRLIGTGNVAGPTLASLGQNFGLQDLISKPLAVISDARLGHADTHQVVERLLAISGRDMLTVDRKYRDPWTGQFPTRFVIISNELPRFGDASGAIANRFVVLALTESWLGREDRTLEPELADELPGILNWALDGLDCLAARDRFTEPKSSVDAVIALADLVSPVAAFVRDRCVRGPGLEVACDHLYAEWKRWAEDNGHRPGSIQTFGRDLRAVVPDLRIHRPREEEGDRRPRRYAGVAMKQGGPHPDPQWLRPRTNADQPADSGAGPQWSATDSIVVPTAATGAEVF